MHKCLFVSALVASIVMQANDLPADEATSSEKEMKPFPAAEDGWQRCAISLPEKGGDEDLWKVEVIAGRKVKGQKVKESRVGRCLTFDFPQLTIS